MKKIAVHTETKTIGLDGPIKPTIPIFEIRNNGGIPMYIDHNFRILAQQTFSLNLEKVVARFIAKGYAVEMENEYQVNWEPPQSVAEIGPGLYPIYIILYYLNKNASYKQVSFITTN